MCAEEVCEGFDHPEAGDTDVEEAAKQLVLATTQTMQLAAAQACFFCFWFSRYRGNPVRVFQSEKKDSWGCWYTSLPVGGKSGFLFSFILVS